MQKPTEKSLKIGKLLVVVSNWMLCRSVPKSKRVHVYLNIEFNSVFYMGVRNCMHEEAAMKHNLMLSMEGV